MNVYSKNNTKFEKHKGKKRGKKMHHLRDTEKATDKHDRIETAAGVAAYCG